jgi:hypothetical protein
LLLFEWAEEEMRAFGFFNPVVSNRQLVVCRAGWFVFIVVV